MHTTHELTTSAFTLVLHGRETTIPELFPGFDEHDRLGVVVHTPGGALGASVLILATITAFYAIQRQRSDDFFIYPDYFVFHVGRRHGNHSMLDIWPEHKDVVVDDDAETILRAVNDRAITRLLVPDGEPGTPEFGRATLASGRPRTALAYAPDGRARDADLHAMGNAVGESYVAAVLEQSPELDAATRESVGAARARLHRDGCPVERYRRISLEDARGLLPTARSA